MILSIKKNTIANIFWAVALISFCFQCYFPSLSKFIVPSLGIFFMLEIPSINFGKVNGWKELYGIYCAYLLFSIINGAFHSCINSSSFRFLIILLIIPLAQLIEEPDFKLEWNTFQCISAARVIPVLFVWIQLLFTQNYSSYRAWAQQTGAGDIYILNGIPRVQLKGSSLFVLTFLVDLYKNKKLTPFGVLMIIGALVSGNSAYILGIAVGLVFFFLPMLKKRYVDEKWKNFVLIPFIIVGFVLFVGYADRSMTQKSGSSNLVRDEQAEVLLDTNPAIGFGLGHPIIANTSTRNYNGNTYFELQTLYILNQIGMIGLLFFYTLTISPYLDRKYMLFAYLSYLIYSFWNPYCFDSTHIITMILISNILKCDDE